MIIWCMVPDIWSATDRIFWYFGIFFWPFTPLTTQKIKILQKWTFHTIAPLMTIIWYMIPEIWTTKDRIFVSLGQFLPFYPTNNPKNQKFQKNEKTWRYHHFKHVYQKQQSFEVQFLRYRVRKTEFYVILVHFLPLYLPNNQENQNF